MAQKNHSTSKSNIIFLSIAAVIILGTIFLLLLNYFIMPAYTNYDEGLTVPDVTETSLTAAKKRLTSYGLRFKVAERRSNDAYPENYVIDQTPKAANIVKPNRKIYLTVNSKVNATVKMPDLVNLSKRNAQMQLKTRGLKMGTISYESSEFKNTVLHQSIPANNVIPKGTKVDLAVSDGLGQEKVKLPKIRGLRLSKAQQKLQNNGLRVGEIQYQPSKKVEPNFIIDYKPQKKQFVKGEKIKLIVAERYNVKEEQESGAVVDSTTNIKTNSDDK